MAQNKSDRILRWAQIKEKYPVSRSTWWRLEKAGIAPKRVRLGLGRATGWRESAVDKMIAELEQVG